MPLTWAPPRLRLSKRKTWYRKSRTCICPKFSLFSPPFACPPLCCSLDCVCVHKKYLASKVLLAKSVYGFWILISLHYVEMLLPRCLAPCPLPTLLLLLLPFFVCGAATTQWRTEEVVSWPGLSLPPLLPWEEEFHYDLSAAFPHSSRSRILCAGYKCTWITKRDRVSLSLHLSLFPLHFSLSLSVCVLAACACGRISSKLWRQNCERATLQILIRQKTCNWNCYCYCMFAAHLYSPPPSPSFSFLFCHLQVAPNCAFCIPFSTHVNRFEFWVDCAMFWILFDR